MRFIFLFLSLVLFEGKAQSNKPNIVFILDDGLGMGDVGSYSQ